MNAHVVLTMLLVWAGGPVLQAATLCWEPWREIQQSTAGWCARGDTHIVVAHGSRDLWTLAAPGQLLGLAVTPAEPDSPWGIFRDGRWRQAVAGHWQASWQAGESCTGVITRADGNGLRAWAMVPGGVQELRIEQRPRLLGLLELPGPAGDALRTDGVNRIWVRRGQVLYTPEGGRMQEAGRLPASVLEWGVSAGHVWILEQNGRLRPLERERPVPGGLPRFVQAWPTENGLWLDTGDGQLWELAAGLIRRLPDLVRHGERLLPGANGLLVLEEESTRRIVAESLGHWQLQRSLDRPPELVDRWLRGRREWRLCRDGNLLLLDSGQPRLLERDPDPLGLVFAGAGPIRVGAHGYSAWSWQGELLGQGVLHSASAAVGLEDHALVIHGNSLLVLDTIEEAPDSVAGIGLHVSGDLALDSRWGVVRLGQRLELLDLEIPWMPRSLGLWRVPAVDGEMLVLEDRLLIAHETDIEAFDLGPTGIHASNDPWVHQGCLHFCRRGPDRLLSIDSRGRLRQMRLVGNLPHHIEWEEEVPLVGRLSIQRDSLRILGPGGALDWPLPTLSTAPDVLPLAREQPRQITPRLTRQGTGWVLNVREFSQQSLSVELIDLRGARHGRWTLLPQQRELLIPGNGLARGFYLVWVTDGAGRRWAGKLGNIGAAMP